jgi:predicted aminopeptidase
MRFLLLLLIVSCAKLSYLTEQGIGQARIQWRGQDNDEVLKEGKLSEEEQRKIILIGEYKKFFYHYFSKKSTDIYSKTTILDSKAVTYLVIASPHTKIEAHEFEFPFVGSFPYIGFFKKESAKDFAESLEKKENLVTYIRPVYAYSSLGYFEDRILSSFFEYDEVELAELVFHELFHTIYFVKDEVDLNENLANLYGRKLLQEYFKDREELKRFLATEEKKAEVSKRVVDLIRILQTEFAKLGGFITDQKADDLRERFVSEVMIPELKALCKKLDLPDDECKLKNTWNQARFAAFLTYEEEQDFLEKLMTQKNLDLREYLKWLKAEEKSFKKQDKIESFTDYLKEKVSHAPTPTH